MNRTLLTRSLRDSWLLLASCCVMSLAFACLRVWVASKIKFDAFIKLFSESLKIFQNLLPVPIEELASPLGRTAFSFEELPVILLLGLWTVARGSDCVAGRVGAGTMEMLLAQPLRRLTVVTSHSAVTLFGVAMMALATWAGVGAGLTVAEYETPPQLSQLIPSMANYAALGIFLVGLATLASATLRTRSQSVGAIMAFYVVQFAFMIVSRLAPGAAWLSRFTIFSAYEPTLLALGIDREPAAYWPIFWQYNAWLVGLGILCWCIAAATFCRRDVPAPL